MRRSNNTGHADPELFSELHDYSKRKKMRQHLSAAQCFLDAWGSIYSMHIDFFKH